MQKSRGSGWGGGGSGRGSEWLCTLNLTYWGGRGRGLVGSKVGGSG